MHQADQDLTVSEFLTNVATHQMEIIKDDGIYRHVRFARPGTSCMHFDLITWPGYLAYVGDMGSYTFSRIRDMFEFFRQPAKPTDANPSGLTINPGYWSEKVQAADMSDGVTEFSEVKFKAKAKRWFDEWADDASDLSAEQRNELWDSIESDVFGVLVDYGAQGAHQAYGAFMDFEHGGSRPFHDFFEVSSDVYSRRFLWCCYALVWGINQYDASQVKPEPEQHTEGPDHGEHLEGAAA